MGTLDRPQGGRGRPWRGDERDDSHDTWNTPPKARLKRKHDRALDKARASRKARRAALAAEHADRERLEALKNKMDRRGIRRTGWLPSDD